jgi:hypothetical protein
MYKDLIHGTAVFAGLAKLFVNRVRVFPLNMDKHPVDTAKKLSSAIIKDFSIYISILRG